MKILEKKERPTVIVNCPHCGSKLEIERSDVFWYKEIDGSNSPGVICGVCHKGFNIRRDYKGVTDLFNKVITRYTR